MAKKVSKSLSAAVSAEIKAKFDLNKFKSSKGLNKNVKFKDQKWIPLSPLKNPVLVSGATGGVGSVAINLLSNLNFEVHAITGKLNEELILKKMGASKVIDRNEFMSEPVKALDKAIYSAGVDTVGGDILSKMLSMIESHGNVACCGNVAGMKFTSSVFPFILRGISLIGVDSAESEINFKKEIWDLFSNNWSLNLDDYSKVISLEDIGDEITKILDGKQIGRVVIKHGD